MQYHIYLVTRNKLNCKHITYGFKGKYDFNGELLNESVKINGNIVKLPYYSMAIAQNYSFWWVKEE